ncbi:MAG: dipeptide ABC transporter ATP-binding protein [Oscillospiraceae bacterium]|nr:dipeptide ABC transporter ATP-binding protein [Oscillospiraceae bacterium]
MIEPILKVVDLEVRYRTKIGSLSAIRNINFDVNRGEVVGIVGESGCGKSTVAAALTRLLPLNGEISSGQILLKGRDICGLSDDEMRKIRGRGISMIFQDAMTSLNPVYNIEQQMTDVIMEHTKTEGVAIKRKAAAERAIKMLERVGIPDAEKRIKDFPHQFSGGMRQRIMIATALLSDPFLLIVDEPTSALDVTLEAQINDLILSMRDESQTSILYITHNLGVIAQLCDRLIVLYAGNIMEAGSVKQVFKNPLHPYTRALLDSHPARDTSAKRLTTIPGRVPSLSDLPIGCKFVGSCTKAQKICHETEPEYSYVDGRRLSCHFSGNAEGEKAGETEQPEQPAEVTQTGETEQLAQTAETAQGLQLSQPTRELQLAQPAQPEQPVQISQVEQPLLLGQPAQPAQITQPAQPVRLTQPAQLAQPARESLIKTQGLTTYFGDSSGFFSRVTNKQTQFVRAVDDVSIDLLRGETLVLVGESGSGKTTFGRTILRLVKPTGGRIIIESRDITNLSLSEIRPMRLKMQMIFQDPIASLSPRKTAAELLLEPFKIHKIKVENKAEKVDELLEIVGLSSELKDKYPHQLSGGQARRIGISRALALRPDVLIADEPTSGLDVSVAAEVLNLMKDLRERLNLTYIIITHNLNITGFIADRVAVMYLGRIVEIGETTELFKNPKHPYTQALLSAVAIPDPEKNTRKDRIILEGEIPSPVNPPSGCHFHPRCRYRQERCSSEAPTLRQLTDNGKGAARMAACHFPLPDNE